MAGAGVGLVWRLWGRRRWGAVPVLLAVIVAAGHADRADRPAWDGMTVLAAVVVVIAAVGTSRLLAQPAVGWWWVAAGSLTSAGCIWAAVPETGPVILAGGALTGSAATALIGGARWAPAAGLAAGGVLGWAALSGAEGRPWAAVGGALCSGLAPWFAVRLRVRAHRWTAAAGPWLLTGHFVVAALAARWIGVVPEPGWHRVGLVALAGLAVIAATPRRA